MTMNVVFSEPVSAATWTINENDNGMQTNQNIQEIIDNANAGDTILFTGLQYTHIHLSINKPLNIISSVGTQLYACPSQFPQGSDNYAAFYINNGASGTNISGFKINNNNQGYGININGTSGINVLNNIISCSNGIGVNVVDSANITLNNNTLTQSDSGIKILNSSSTSILNNQIIDNNENGILFGKNVFNTSINHNNVTSNLNTGINLLESCNNVSIKDNYISLNNRTTNTGCGIYINSTISGLNITGNFIYKNGNLGICDDIGVTELTEATQNIENNFITGHSFRDVVRYVEEGGNIVRKEVWLKEDCFGGSKSLCPSAHLVGEAIMSHITQLAPGIYSVSFIDEDTGLTSTGFGSFYVTFFLNKNNTNKGAADAGDIWKEVLVKNGTATVNFTNYTYKTTNNSIFAIAPYDTFSTAMKDQFTVNDSNIPSSKVNLSAHSSASKSTLKNGETLVYKFTVKNNGNKNATGVKVSNILSPTYYYSTAKAPRGSYSNGVWNIGTLKAGETLTISINARAKKSGITKSQAKLTGTNINTAYSNVIQTTIKKYIKMSYRNSVSSYNIKKGKYVYLTSKASNSGKDKSYPIKIKITLPKGMKLVSVAHSSWYNKKTKTWTFTVPAGKTYSFKVKAKVTSRGTKKVVFNINGKTQNKYIKGY